MSPSKVYYGDLRADWRENLPQKLARLCKTAGMGNIDFSGKYTAIKMHFGEPGNLAFLRPNWAKVVADLISGWGGKPFLTDCNTLYTGGRTNGLDHLSAAAENGFSPLSTGCHVVIADGIKGTDEVGVPVEGGEYVTEAKIGRAIMDADIFITLNHFKGHEATGFGGALKNIGMGCGSRAGKMEMHSSGKPSVEQDSCIGCGSCLNACAHNAISVTDKAFIDHNRCVGCDRCSAYCPVGAIQAPDSSNDVLNCKIAEYSKAVLSGRPHFHISLILDVSPNCDCHSENDYPIVPNIGMFASFDPVALDKACADAVNAAPALPGSVLFDADHHEHEGDPDHFHHSHPDTDWIVALQHAEKLGIGTTEYELIRI